MSISGFLSKAKHSLSKSIKSNGEHQASFVIGNESADLDSITCAIVYGYLQSSTAAARKADKYIIPITNIKTKDLRLRPELTTLLKHANLKPSDLITLDDLGNLQDHLPSSSTYWTLVDHNVLQGTLGQHYSSCATAVIDHHEDEGKVFASATPRIIQKSGSCNSLIVNHLRESWDSISSAASTSGAAHGQGDGALDDAAYTANWDAQLAKLALGSILIDTYNLQDENKTTDDDRKAVRYLEAKINISPRIGKSYDRDAFFQEISDAKSDLDDLSVREILEKDYKQWDEGELTLGISACVRSIDYLLAKESDILPILLEFARQRQLDLFAVTTSHKDKDLFERQLLLLGVDEGKAVDVAEKFVRDNAEELQLNDSNTHVDSKKAMWLKVWEQKNLAASRKQVAPLLRKAMR
jgi:exopolyphosphatase